MGQEMDIRIKEVATIATNRRMICNIVGLILILLGVLGGLVWIEVDTHKSVAIYCLGVGPGAILVVLGPIKIQAWERSMKDAIRAEYSNTRSSL